MDSKKEMSEEMKPENLIATRDRLLAYLQGKLPGNQLEELILKINSIVAILIKNSEERETYNKKLNEFEAERERERELAKSVEVKIEI